jgi:hypothetical protein
MAKPISLGNRRASIRYRCAPATVGRIISTDDQEFQLACILDLSRKGVGMQVVRPIAAGRIVIITMKTSDGGRTVELPAKVMHCHAAPHEEWFVGCELATMLSADDLEQLL